MNWNHLYCFYEVAKQRSVKEAASHMGLSSSTVSEQVKKFETSNNLELFIRSGRELHLTQEGEKIYNYARTMFDTGLKLLDSLSFNDVAGYTVKLSVENHLENSSLDEFLCDYWEIYSPYGLVESKRSKNLSQTIYFLDNDITDLAITSTFLEDKRYDSLKVADFSFDFYCSEEVYKTINSVKEKKELMKSMPVASFGTNENLISDIKNYLINNKIYAKEQFNSEHLDLLKTLCKRGKIILVMPVICNHEAVGLKKISFKEPLKIPIYAMFKKSNAQLLFIRKLVELMANLNIQDNDLSQYTSLQFSAKDLKPINDRLQ